MPEVWRAQLTTELTEKPAACLFALGLMPVSPRPSTHTHTDCIYITGCRAPLWQWNVLWLRHGPKCKQHHKEMRFQVNIFPMSDKVGETLCNASVFKALEHVFPNGGRPDPEGVRENTQGDCKSTPIQLNDSLPCQAECNLRVLMQLTSVLYSIHK